jgi:hypothetical protein
MAHNYKWGTKRAVDNEIVNTKTQPNGFALVTNESRRRGWIIPIIDTSTIGILKNWQVQ